MSNKEGVLSPNDMVQAISQHEVFAGFDDTILTQLEEIVEYVTVGKNEQVFKIGDQPRLIYFLLKGSLTLKFPDNSTIFLQEGELIGEIGMLNGDFRLGTLTANVECSLIAIHGTRIYDPAYIAPQTGLIILSRLSKRVTNYLRSVQQTSTQEIINQGESDYVEFKSSLRWNLLAAKRDKRITHAILKSIAAFLNSEGGILLVGVADDGAIVGLEADQFVNDDKMLLFLTDNIKTQLGALHLENVHYHIEKINGLDVLRIDVRSGTDPCYLAKENLEHFYIRTGPSTTSLKLSKVFDYINNRFGK